MNVGLISDTHDLMRPEALAALAGVDVILHAGDVCGPRILQALEALAPVSVVRGNCDGGPWAEDWPEYLTLELEGVKIHMVHDLGLLNINPAAEGVSIVLSGHSHIPGVRTAGSVQYVNPGSAGRRRFTHPVSVGKLRIAHGKAEVELIELAVANG
jgi:uncharacterized protein